MASVVGLFAKTLMNKNQYKNKTPSGCQPNFDHGGGQKEATAFRTRRTQKGCHDLNLATYNVRTLSNCTKLMELQEEIKNIKFDVIGLSEVRRKGVGYVEMDDGHILHYRGTESGRTSGVGFLVHRSWKNNIVECDGSSDRLIRLVLRLNERYTIQIIQAYAPTQSYSDEEVEDFYEELQNLKERGKAHFQMVMGDFNARIGSRVQDDTAVGKFGYGDRDERGDRLVAFAERNNLVITNSFFQKRFHRKWTWKSPNGSTSEIDYILSNNINNINDCSVLNNFNTGSDHRMVRCKFRANIKLERSKLVKRAKPRVDLMKLRHNKTSFQLELHNKFSTLQTEDTSTADLTNIVTQEIVKAADKFGGGDSQQRSKLSRETIELINKRRSMNNQHHTGNNETEFSSICKSIRKNITKDIRKYNVDLIKDTVEKGKSLKKLHKKLYPKAKDITAIKLLDNTVTTNRDMILRRMVEFYSDLYDDPDTYPKEHSNHNINDQLPDVLPSEVRKAITDSKSGKAPGEDDLSIDVLKESGKEVDKMMAKIFTDCLREQNIPDKWKSANIILIHKKGDKEDLKNYRPISLLPTLYKLLTKILSNRLKRKFDENQPKEQAGFRGGYSTMDHIQVVKTLIERSEEYELPLCMAFVDYEKAFDSIKTDAIINALKNQGIPIGYVTLLSNIYNKATANLKLQDKTEKFNIRKGVRQGDTISPKLFTAALEEVFKRLEWQERGININGTFLSHLRFADDIVVFANTPEELQKCLQELTNASEMVGLKMNIDKTKYMNNRFSENKNILLNNIELEKVQKYTYLGQDISFLDNTINEVTRRAKLAWSSFGRLNYILKSSLPMCLRRKVFNQCILPVLTYGSETWTLSAKAIQKLQTTQRSMERCMLGVTRRDRMRIETIRAQTRVDDVIETCKRLKWSWAGHIARATDHRWTYEIIQWYPRGIKRPRRRPKARWVDDIKKYAGTTWQRLAQDRIRWRLHGEAYILQWRDTG